MAEATMKYRKVPEGVTFLSCCTEKQAADKDVMCYDCCYLDREGCSKISCLDCVFSHLNAADRAIYWKKLNSGTEDTETNEECTKFAGLNIPKGIKFSEECTHEMAADKTIGCGNISNDGAGTKYIVSCCGQGITCENCIFSYTNAAARGHYFDYLQQKKGTVTMKKFNKSMLKAGDYILWGDGEDGEFWEVIPEREGEHVLSYVGTRVCSMHGANDDAYHQIISNCNGRVVLVIRPSFNCAVAKLQRALAWARSGDCTYNELYEHLIKMKDVKIVWKEEEATEMTVEEISKALGYEVKVVKG